MNRSFPRWLACLACLTACSTQPASEATLVTDTAAASDVGQEDAASQTDADAGQEADLASVADGAEPDQTPADIAADVTDADAAPDLDADSTPSDATVDAASDIGADTKSCKPGTQMCQGAMLATCAPKGDGYGVSKCFPGTACIGGSCKPVSNNLLLIFDTSGSMTASVNKKDGTPLCKSAYTTWPKCEDPAQFPDGCSRLGVSKSVFLKALAKLDDQVTHMSLFRFPQTGGLCSSSACSCSSGGYDGQSEIKGDTSAQAVGETSAWFWNNLSQIMCVAFPKAKGEQTKVAVNKWMDNVQDANNPELRAAGGTPIGKSLFYIGEYIRNRVVIDGKACKVDEDCGNANYACDLSGCKDASCVGKCKDAARSCRDTIVILFTDGGETSTNSYFGPWVQAKRMAMGLGCATDADCVGDATCQKVAECMGSATQLGSGHPCNPDNGDGDCVDDKTMKTCKSFQQCMPKAQASNYQCSEGGAACLPTCVGGTTSGCVQAPKPGEDPSPAYCSGQCTRDPRMRLTTLAADPANNVLRSPDGKPFAVRLYVVDIGSLSATDIQNSMSLAISGGGKLLGADASDPVQFLGALEKAFDLKNKNVCGVEL